MVKPISAGVVPIVLFAVNIELSRKIKTQLRQFNLLEVKLTAEGSITGKPPAEGHLSARDPVQRL
jgi:hypothetical protein